MLSYLEKYSSIFILIKNILGLITNVVAGIIANSIYQYIQNNSDIRQFLSENLIFDGKFGIQLDTLLIIVFIASIIMATFYGYFLYSVCKESLHNGWYKICHNENNEVSLIHLKYTGANSEYKAEEYKFSMIGETPEFAPYNFDVKENNFLFLHKPMQGGNDLNGTIQRFNGENTLKIADVTYIHGGNKKFNNNRESRKSFLQSCNNKQLPD